MLEAAIPSMIIEPLVFPFRIGILLNELEEVNVAALKFLILQLNRLQTTFEYEFLPIPPGDDFLLRLRSPGLTNRDATREHITGFAKRYTKYLARESAAYGLKESPPTYYVVVSLARFSDEFYSARKANVSILALGNWQRCMAPPSIFEFLLTLVMREAVAAISSSLRGSVHLGTKGCLFDFTSNLEDAKHKVLSAFVCAHCRTALDNDGLSHLKTEIPAVLEKKWLGNITEPNTPACTIAKLGHNLFATKGLQATWPERFLSTLQVEGVKQLMTLTGAVLAAMFLAWLGLKKL